MLKTTLAGRHCDFSTRAIFINGRPESDPPIEVRTSTDVQRKHLGSQTPDWEHPTHGAGPGDSCTVYCNIGVTWVYPCTPTVVRPSSINRKSAHVFRNSQAFLARETSLLPSFYFSPFALFLVSHLSSHVAPPPTTQHLTTPTITIRTRPTTA